MVERNQKCMDVKLPRNFLDHTRLKLLKQDYAILSFSWNAEAAAEAKDIIDISSRAFG